MPSPDAPRGAGTRLEIIRAAHDLFIRKGYHGTSMRQIARDAGLALGGIYNHFSGKEDIFREVLFTYHPYHEIIAAVTSEQYDDFETLIRKAAHLINASFAQQPDLIHLMFIEMVEFRSSHIPELLDRILPQVSSIFAGFAQEGSPAYSVPVPVIIRTFIGSVLGYFLTENALGKDGPEAFRQVTLEQFLDIYLNGILDSESTT